MNLCTFQVALPSCVSFIFLKIGVGDLLRGQSKHFGLWSLAWVIGMRACEPSHVSCSVFRDSWGGMPWSAGCDFQFKQCGEKMSIQFLEIQGWDQAKTPATGWRK